MRPPREYDDREDERRERDEEFELPDRSPEYLEERDEPERDLFDRLLFES